MTNRVLGIEFADDRIKVVEVGFGRKLKVFNFAVIDNRNIDPGRRVDQFNHALQVRGFQAKDAAIATSGGNVEHRLLTLPPLSTREMHFVMQRESKKLGSAGTAEMLWSYDVVKTREELGIKKNQILLVTADRPMVEAAQNFLSQTRLKLHQVTTIPEAVMNLHRNVSAWKKDAVRTIVHFAGNGVHIVFAQEGVLLLSREIHFDSTDLSQDEQGERLVNELKRSTLYFRQNFPVAQLDQLVFSGDNDILGSLVTLASEELGMPGNILRFEENLDISGFRGSWDEFRFHLPALTAALGTAWRKTLGSSGINLLPGKTQAKAQAGINPTKIAKAACAGAAGLALLTGIYYVREKGTLDADLLAASERAAVVDPKLQAGQAVNQRRSAAAEREAFLKRLGARVDWGEILRSLSFVVPETGLFENIHVEGGDQVKMTIQGRVLAPTAAQANSDFARFFNDVRALPFFKAVTMPKSPVVAFEDVPPAAATPVAAAQSRGRVSFEIICELR